MLAIGGVKSIAGQLRSSSGLTIGPSITFTGGILSPASITTNTDGSFIYFSNAVRTAAAAGGFAFYADSGSFTSAAGSGSIGLGLVTAGARLKFSSGGTTDYFISDGATVISTPGQVRSSLGFWTNTNTGVYLDTAGSQRIYGDGTNITGNVPFLLTNSSLVAAGSGTATPSVPGTLNVTSSPVTSSGAGSSLMSYTMPANTLVGATRGLRITAWGTCLNNANAKTVSLAFGSQTVISKALNVSLANGTWRLTVNVIRTGASTQDVMAEGYNNNAVAVSGTDGATILYAATHTAGTQTETATIVIKGVATTATTTDITQTGMTVEYI